MEIFHFAIDDNYCYFSLLLFREWYLNGNYLVILVTVGIILPLSLLKSLGKLNAPLNLISSFYYDYEFICS